MFRQVYVLFFALLINRNIHFSTACNGYSLKLNHARNCLDNSVIQIQNGGATLDKDCNVILSGCLNIVKGFKTAKGKYTLKKAPMPPMEGQLDFCEVVKGLDDPQIGNVAKMYNMPSNCPVPARKVCGDANKKINIGKYKNQLGIAAGTVDLKLEADHDSGKTCIEVNLNISRAKARG